jgi:murein DD-endopeptidase MepM/ murein hydrolase activator NlpD
MTKYPEQSAYVGFNNNPIYYSDPKGLEGEEGNKDVQKHKISSGETLTGIAKQYNTSVETLQAWNDIADPNKIYAGNELIVSDPSRPSDHKKFEDFEAPKPSTGSVLNPNNDWSGHGEHSKKVEWDAAENMTELLAASGRGTDIVYLYGEFSEKIQSDPDMLDKQNEVIALVKENTEKYGKEAFYLTGKFQVTFGGKRDAFFSMETVEAAGNSLTWGVRHAEVKYWVEVSNTGTMSIQYRLTDRLDLSPNGSSLGYDIISGGLGFFYHTLGGANKNLQTRSVWNIIIE